MSLPAGFAELEPFVDAWAVPSMTGRQQQLLHSSYADKESLYNAMDVRLEAVMAHLNAIPLDRIEGADLRLLRLTLAAFQASRAIEVVGRAQDAEHSHHAAMLSLSHEFDQI